MEQTDNTQSASQSAEAFMKGLWKENPIFIMVLGMCPVMAVTNTVINSLAMGVATLFVLVVSCTLVSLLRNAIPAQVRITSYIIIIATFVTVVDFLLAAMAPAVHKELGAFIALIVVNCLILGRAEAFAARNTVKLAILDALGMGLGFTFALLCIGAFRELLGNGSLMGINILGPHFEPWVIMVLPPGGFLTLGFLLLFFNWMKQRKAQASSN